MCHFIGKAYFKGTSRQGCKQNMCALIKSAEMRFLWTLPFGNLVIRVIHTLNTQPSISLKAGTADRESTCVHFMRNLKERSLIATGGPGTNPQRILRDDCNVSSPVLSSCNVLLHSVSRTTLTQAPLHAFIYKSKK